MLPVTIQQVQEWIMQHQPTKDLLIKWVKAQVPLQHSKFGTLAYSTDLIGRWIRKGFIVIDDSGILSVGRLTSWNARNPLVTYECPVCNKQFEIRRRTLAERRNGFKKRHGNLTFITSCGDDLCRRRLRTLIIKI